MGEINDLIEVPIYDKEEMNAIERDIEKAELVSRFKAAMEDNPYMETYTHIERAIGTLLFYF